MLSPLVSRKSLLISLLGHLTIFSIVNVSFGSRIPRADFAGVSFWGAVLNRAQVCAPVPAGDKGVSFSRPLPAGAPVRAESGMALSSWRQKPHFGGLLGREKPAFHRPLFSPPKPIGAGKQPMILLHPLLPYSFGLYFKDRQVAHVELMFNIESSGLRNSIALKRRISSGNLEVDLLCMRYIGHYLFIEQEKFAPHKWQTVKIDLSEG